MKKIRKKPARKNPNLTLSLNFKIPRTGHVIDLYIETFRVFFRHFTPILKITIPVFILMGGVDCVWAAGNFYLTPVLYRSFIMALLFLIQFSLVCFAMTAVYYSILTEFRTKQVPSLGESYSWGFSRLGDVMINNFLFLLIIALGICLLVVPGIIWSYTFSFCLTIAVIKGAKGVEAFKESAKLTKNHHWMLLITYVLLGITVGWAEKIINSIWGTLLSFFPTDSLAKIGLAQLPNIFFMLGPVMFLLAYLHFSKRKG